MKKMFLPLLVFVCQPILAQQLYQMPEGIQQSSISTFENLNGVKMPVVKPIKQPRAMPLKI